MVILHASRNKLNRTAEFCTFCKQSIKNLGRPYGNELQLSNSQGLMEEPVHLGFFGYELSGWQATIVEIELMLVKRELEGLENFFRLVTFSNSLLKRQAIIFIFFSSRKVILIDKNFF